MNTTETMSELELAAARAETGVHDPEAMLRAIEEMRARVQASSVLGTEPFAARTVREFRGYPEE